MTKMVQEAIEALKELPEDRQVTVARAILDYASHDDDIYHLTDDERREGARRFDRDATGRYRQRRGSDGDL
jgi:hypothetical protein